MHPLSLTRTLTSLSNHTKAYFSSDVLMCKVSYIDHNMVDLYMTYFEMFLFFLRILFYFCLLLSTFNYFCQNYQMRLLNILTI